MGQTHSPRVVQLEPGWGQRIVCLPSQHSCQSSVAIHHYKMRQYLTLQTDRMIEGMYFAEKDVSSWYKRVIGQMDLLYPTDQLSDELFFHRSAYV